MTRKKLIHFDEMKDWPHVFEPEWGTDSGLAGTWDAGGSGAGSSVILELACGRGHYTIALAQRNPDATVVGVDIKGARMWHGANEALDLGLTNAKFLRTRIEDLAQHFAPGEVDEIWITFPDPRPREGSEKRRLTSPRFLEIYKNLLKPGGRLNLKTDDTDLFEWSLEVLRERGVEPEIVCRDVYADGGEVAAGEISKALRELLHVQTQYEKKFLAKGRKIKYLCAVLN